jgi:hypothetical protein
VGVKDYGSAARVVEAVLNDGFLTSAEVEKQTIVAALINYQIKYYDKAIQFGNRAIRLEKLVAYYRTPETQRELDRLRTAR